MFDLSSLISPHAQEFESSACDALLTSEVFLLLEHRRAQSEQKEEIEDLSEVGLSKYGEAPD